MLQIDPFAVIIPETVLHLEDVRRGVKALPRHVDLARIFPPSKRQILGLFYGVTKFLVNALPFGHRFPAYTEPRRHLCFAFTLCAHLNHKIAIIFVIICWAAELFNIQARR